MLKRTRQFQRACDLRNKSKLHWADIDNPQKEKKEFETVLGETLKAEKRKEEAKTP